MQEQFLDSGGQKKPEYPTHGHCIALGLEASVVHTNSSATRVSGTMTGSKRADESWNAY
jgi:hypothetical protein